MMDDERDLQKLREMLDVAVAERAQAVAALDAHQRQAHEQTRLPHGRAGSFHVTAARCAGARSRKAPPRVRGGEHDVRATSTRSSGAIATARRSSRKSSPRRGWSSTVFAISATRFGPRPRWDAICAPRCRRASTSSRATSRSRVRCSRTRWVRARSIRLPASPRAACRSRRTAVYGRNRRAASGRTPRALLSSYPPGGIIPPVTEVSISDAPRSVAAATASMRAPYASSALATRSPLARTRAVSYALRRRRTRPRSR